jgi:hypothetical protein
MWPMRDVIGQFLRYTNVISIVLSIQTSCRVDDDNDDLADSDSSEDGDDTEDKEEEEENDGDGVGCNCSSCVLTFYLGMIRSV